MKVFKIRKKGTNLFSSGGSSPNWTTKGKTWAAMSHVSNHLGVAPMRVYADAEIVEYDVVEVAAQDAAAIVEAKRQAKLKKELKAAQEARKRKEDAEREQLRQLQAKYGK